MLAAMSAYDLGYLNLDEAISLIEKIIKTVNKLQKWNGHLYNWYNTKTLEPLTPRFISSVDSGNFVGYLYVVKQFLNEISGRTGSSAPTNINRQRQPNNCGDGFYLFI